MGSLGADILQFQDILGAVVTGVFSYSRDTRFPTIMAARSASSHILGRDGWKPPLRCEVR